MIHLSHVPSHGVISQGSTLRGPVAVALRLCPILGHRQWSELKLGPSSSLYYRPPGAASKQPGPTELAGRQAANRRLSAPLSTDASLHRRLSPQTPLSTDASLHRRLPPQTPLSTDASLHSLSAGPNA